MLHKLTFAGLAGLGLLGAAPAADAMTVARHGHHVAYARHHPKRYRILYRTCDRDPWVVYGRYSHRWAADRAAHRLQHRGFEVFVR